VQRKQAERSERTKRLTARNDKGVAYLVKAKPAEKSLKEKKNEQ